MLLQWLFLLLATVTFAAPLPRPARQSIAPYLSGDTFRAYCDFAYDELDQSLSPASVRRGDTIFVKVDYLQNFFQNIHPRISAPYILISHNGDLSAPGKFKEYLDDDKLIAWFLQNQDNTSHPKLHAIPIGVENREWNATNVQVLEQTRAMHLPKMHLAYCNINVNTFPSERSIVHALFHSAPFAYSPKRKDYTSFIKDLASSKFVISPRGNGLDTHRLWETLYAGSFPIVKTSSLDALYEGLPVVIVKEWSDVTEEFLERKYRELTSGRCSYEKLYTDFWFRWIDSYRRY